MIKVVVLFVVLAAAGCAGNAAVLSLSTPAQSVATTGSDSSVLPPGTTAAPAMGTATSPASTNAPALTATASISAPTTITPGTTPVATGSADVEVTHGGFSPGKITIAVGTTINWVAPQHERLVVESETEAIEGFAISFWTTAQTTFDAPGVYTFHLEEGPYTTCVITVVAQ
jgi:plastocyanin